MSDSDEVARNRNWIDWAANWAVNQSFSVLVASALMYAGWRMATDVVPSSLRQISQENTAAMERVVKDLNIAFDRRIEQILASHEKDRVSWEKDRVSWEKDRELLLTFLREKAKGAQCEL